MLALNERFLLGKYINIFEVTCKEGNPFENFLKLMFSEKLIDGLLTCSKDGLRPKLILNEDEVEVPRRNSCFGVNSLLKRAVQKYQLSRIAVLSPACVFDGINKTQYYGIGCNWVKTAIALKVGILCPGSLVKTAFLTELLDITERKGTPDRFFFKEGRLFYEFKGKRFKVPLDVHHRYINPACRYCLNLSSKGSDITCVFLEEEERALFIVRSERGWSTIGKLQLKRPDLLLFRKAKEELINGVLEFLREKTLLNISDIIERIELGLPLPKWNDQKLRKFYRLWNSINQNFEEEVF
ncbi:MAG: hypothetical protein DSZ25_01120 [Thermovibrio sp.]|nr:MAG: hypothetical protein DSZ25_01120 [Thermovibrio sp.]